MSQLSIRVVNSTGRTISRTNPKSAKTMIERGIARARGSAVELIEDDYRVDMAAIEQRASRASGHAAPDDGLATLSAIKHLPVAGNVIRILAGKRATGPVLADRRFVLRVTPLPATQPRAYVPTWRGVPLIEGAA